MQPGTIMLLSPGPSMRSQSMCCEIQGHFSLAENKLLDIHSENTGQNHRYHVQRKRTINRYL